MTPSRALILLGLAAAASLAGGVGLLVHAFAPEARAVAFAPSAAAPAIRAPEPVRPDPSPQEIALRTEVFGALSSGATLSGSFSPSLKLRSSRDFAPPPPTTTAPLAEDDFAPVASDAPLPPVRPAEFAGLPPDAQLSAETPLPPVRPTDLQVPGLVQVASLEPQLPEMKPPLVEPKPPAESPAAETQPDVPFTKGQAAYVRIFKQEGQLELWLKRGDKYGLYKTYPICKWSGHLGPKLKEADYQSPEGFYNVSAKQLRPNSHYYRAFDVGFPNALDKQMGYSGGLIMVHGDCKSVGCYAMTNAGIDEIYGYVAAAISSGQREVPVHIFPFRMTETAVARETGGGWLSFAPGAYTQYASFWRNLKEGYDLFEQTGEPPTAYACGGKYAFNDGAACKRIAGW